MTGATSDDHQARADAVDALVDAAHSGAAWAHLLRMAEGDVRCLEWACARATSLESVGDPARAELALALRMASMSANARQHARGDERN